MIRQIVITIYVLFSVPTLSAYAEVAVSKNAPKVKRPSNVLLSIRHIQGSKYGVAVFNLTPKTIVLGEAGSMLGRYQFQFRIRTSGDIAFVKRRVDIISPDWLTPITVRPGSYYEYVVDFGDRSWKTKGAALSSWKSIMVEYENTDAAEIVDNLRKDGYPFSDDLKRIGLYRKKLQSKWVAIQQP